MNTRKELIVKYCKNRKVLNVGCTSDFPEDELKADLWLHKNIEEYTKKLVGIDIKEKLLEKCRKYTETKLIFADATNFNLNETFDTIFAGEIIEHISNLDGFLKCLKKHLKPQGVLIITTPNVFKLKNIIRAVFGLKPPRHPDHILYFDLYTLKELLERYDFKIMEYAFTTEKTITHSLGNKIMIFLGSFIKQYNESLVVVCK